MLILFTVLAVPLLILMIDACAALGSKPSGPRLERFARSPQFVDGRFRNTLPAVSDGLSLATARKYLSGGSEHRQPLRSPPVHARAAEDLREPTAGMRVTWLGHSTLVVEIEGTRVLLDPVWGLRASPSRFVGSRRFYAPPVALEALPPIDAVVISHDHYDHLDRPTVRALTDRVGRWVVPLGIGAHLEGWGIEPAAIDELDWWEEVGVGGVRLVSTPARHFSGRGLTDRDATLWTGWAFIGSRHRAW